MASWLPAVISVAFLGEGIWRIAAEYGEATPPGLPASREAMAGATFNCVNFVLFSLLGLLCVCWPFVSTWFHRKPEGEMGDSSASGSHGPSSFAPDPPSTTETQVKVVVDGADKGPPAPAPVHAPEPEPKPKRTITYLTNLKTFLTFIVVAHHSVGQWYNSSASGIGTLGYDPLIEGSQQLPSFSIFASFFMFANQGYFMATFFLISGLFCPRSLDRKGFRNFVLDKMVRLGGPFLIYSVLLGPAMDLWISAYGGFPLSWKYNMGPPWFILWLLNFSILYAAIAHFLPKMRQFTMPHPLLVVLFGFVLAPCFWALGSVLGGWAFLGGMVFWNFGLFIYIPFFIAGVVGGRNGWLKSVEEMKTWVVWVLRAMCLVVWVLIFLSNAQTGIPIPNCCGIDGSFFLSFIPPVYAIVMTLALMQLFHQYFNATPQSSVARGAGQAAYMVYVIHLPILMTAVIAMAEILKAAGLDLLFFAPGAPIVAFFPSDASGNLAVLSDGWLWAGFFFTLIVTNIVVWPLGFYMRRLPVLNKMF